MLQSFVVRPEDLSSAFLETKLRWPSVTQFDLITTSFLYRFRLS
jgi:hypothetical protein